MCYYFPVMVICTGLTVANYVGVDAHIIARITCNALHVPGGYLTYSFLIFK